MEFIDIIFEQHYRKKVDAMFLQLQQQQSNAILSEVEKLILEKQQKSINPELFANLVDSFNANFKSFTTTKGKDSKSSEVKDSKISVLKFK